MKTLLISAAAALGALTLAAAPASAQDYRAGYDRPGYDRAAYAPSHAYGDRSGFQLQRIEERLRFGVRTGNINRWEARRLFSELRDVRGMRAEFLSTRGMSPREAAILQDRIQQLRMAVRIESNDRDFRRF